MIFQLVKEKYFDKILRCNIFKDIWDLLERNYKIVENVKKVRLNTLKGEFKALKMNDAKSVDDYYNRVTIVINSFKFNGKDISEVEIIKKFLRSLPSNFEHIVCIIEERKDLSIMTIEELVGSLQSHELWKAQREPSPILRVSFLD